MMNGMKKVLRRFAAWKTCKAVVTRKKEMKTTAAGSEGWYLVAAASI
jgi:hypothetical protein